MKKFLQNLALTRYIAHNAIVRDKEFPYIMELMEYGKYLDYAYEYGVSDKKTIDLINKLYKYDEYKFLYEDAEKEIYVQEACIDGRKYYAVYWMGIDNMLTFHYDNKKYTCFYAVNPHSSPNTRKYNKDIKLLRNVVKEYRRIKYG